MQEKKSCSKRHFRNRRNFCTTGAGSVQKGEAQNVVQLRKKQVAPKLGSKLISAELGRLSARPAWLTTPPQGTAQVLVTVPCSCEPCAAGGSLHVHAHELC